MKNGWIKLYRKILDNPLYRERREFSRFEAWIDLLLNASHKENDFILGSEMAHCARGELITSETKLMERWHWSKSKVRYFLNVLLKDQSIDQKSDHRKTRIIIKNYSTYQDSQTTERPPNEPVYESPKDPIKKKRSKEVKKPCEISEEISVLISKLFPGEEELFQEVKQAISSTRKTKKVSSGVILSLLRNLEKYPKEKIWAGARTYLEREHWKDGKDERYLVGIIRNESKRVSSPQESKKKGSPSLDAYYQRQGRSLEAPKGINPAGSGSPMYDKALADYHSGKLKPKENAE